VNCDYDVIVHWFLKVLKVWSRSGAEYDIRKCFGVKFVGVGVESESEIIDSAHLCHAPA